MTFDRSFGSIHIRSATGADLDWRRTLLQARRGDPHLFIAGQVLDALGLPALIAIQGGQNVGLLTYRLARESLDVVSLDVTLERQGAGSMLVDAATEVAWQQGLSRVSAYTSNDRLDALRFYQRRGFHLAELRPRALEDYLTENPHLKRRGKNGIPVRDEVRLDFYRSEPH